MRAKLSDKCHIDVRAIRQSRSIKQRELAASTGLGVNALMKIERGLTTLTPQLELVFAEAFNLSLAELRAFSRSRESGEGYVTAKPSGQNTVSRRKKTSDSKLPVVDLFCGVGGFSNGFEQTGQFEVVAGVDLLGDRLDTFIKNHGHANGYGQDIRYLKLDTLMSDNPRPFVVVGGPPCQGFSSIRPFRNVTWSDPRNNMAEEFCRIVSGLQPEWVVFENVVGLLTHDNGRMVQAIREAFEECGYRTDARVLNAANFGLPQRRERLIIVGNRKGKAFKWPSPTHVIEGRSMVGASELLVRPDIGLFAKDLPPAVTLQQAIHDLPFLKAGESASSYNDDIVPTEYEIHIRNGSTLLTMHDATKHSEKMLEIVRHAGSNISALPPGMVKSGFSSCYSRLAADEPSVTLTVNFVHPASNRCIHPTQDRALTPREGARLQGFFDTFQFCGTRAQTVKQIGNAVPPVLGKVIAESLLESN